ncbi:hypothetical protein CR513_24198, partial [Mucuna pruriens]
MTTWHRTSRLKIRGHNKQYHGNPSPLIFKDEVPTKGWSHNQPLHIAVKCGNYMIARVLIDNGSSLNVMPKATLDKLYGSGATLKNSPGVVRAFNRSKREVMGEITLPKRIRPTIFDITFQVIDIRSAYSCFLGKPWIHTAGAVSFSLHQKVKFITDQHYVEGDEEALEASFQALEIVGTTSAESEGGSLKPSKAAIMVTKENSRRSKLGYIEATKGGSRRKTQRIRPNLYRYFTNEGIVSPNQIVVVEGQPLVQAKWVKPMKGMLTNWTTEALPELVSQKM